MKDDRVIFNIEGQIKSHEDGDVDIKLAMSVAGMGKDIVMCLASAIKKQPEIREFFLAAVDLADIDYDEITSNAGVINENTPTEELLKLMKLMKPTGSNDNLA
jgi:hypothetical protein